ncbi:MAG: aspartate--tRNA ligase [Flavobacteriales bacterium]
MSTYRTHNCGQLRMENVGSTVRLSGWTQRVREMGGMIFIDLRDRYGITQLKFDQDINQDLVAQAKGIGRESVLQIDGTVIERSSKNKNIPTGEIEIEVTKLTVLNASITPPFTIEDNTDGGDDIRMKYRYLDLRRNPVRENLILRSKVAIETRKFLSDIDFIEVETPVLIKSTPEGARDFVVPSRMNQGEFYALPQSPQTFKQLLMVGGFDKYFQIVKCFRDEDLRADRQPEFTQIDCEMSFVDQEDILNTFESLTKHLLKVTKNVELGDFPRMTYDEAMLKYGSDKPDTRFGMEFVDFTELTQNKGFAIFDNSEAVLGIVAKGCSGYSRKQTDKLIKWVKRPQIGASGMIFAKWNEDGTFKSSVDKFYGPEELQKWFEKAGGEKGDMILLLSGGLDKTRKQLCELRLEMGSQLNLKDPEKFSPLWVIDFPLLEWDEDSERFHAMHHPFTSPKTEDLDRIGSHPADVRANAYDLVLNGSEIGGGSIRIHDREIQKQMFTHLGFTDEEAKAQFGFLMEAFEYGAPPHGGIAFGLDRLCSIIGGSDSIRDYIAFPKNNSGRDVMIDAPSKIDNEQLNDLALALQPKQEKN